jgi:hypothetical protein
MRNEPLVPIPAVVLEAAFGVRLEGVFQPQRRAVTLVSVLERRMIKMGQHKRLRPVLIERRSRRMLELPLRP